MDGKTAALDTAIERFETEVSMLEQEILAKQAEVDSLKENIRELRDLRKRHSHRAQVRSVIRSKVSTSTGPEKTVREYAHEALCEIGPVKTGELYREITRRGAQCANSNSLAGTLRRYPEEFGKTGAGKWKVL